MTRDNPSRFTGKPPTEPSRSPVKDDSVRDRSARGSRPTSPTPPNKRRSLVIALAAAATVVLFTFFNSSASQVKTTTLSYTQFQSDVVANGVKTASINESGQVSGILADGTHYSSVIPVAVPQNELSSQLATHHVQVTGVVTSTGGVSLITLVVDFAPLLLLIGYFVWSARRLKKQMGGGGGGGGGGGLGGLLGVGRAKTKVYDEDRPKTRFSDVAGYEGAKAEVSEVVDFLKHPARYERAGATGPKGVLMAGPPGTGKTLLARAVAGEADVPFLALTGSSFVEMFVGVGASRVRDLFADARKRAPSIIFIDEIDAIGGRRSSGGGFAGNDEREQTLNQMLAEMDGFDPATGVVVIAATNRPESLDPALLRPGRFDRTVEIPLPNQREREAILGSHVRDKTMAADVDLNAVSRGTPGFSGADLANLANEAAINAVRDGRDIVHEIDFDVARDRLLIGRRDSSNALMPEEKYSVAVHESGHALVAALSKNADPVSKVTILPAGSALGVTQQLPEVERHLYPHSYLLDSLAVRLGGRAAELLILGEASTGAANDLAGATQLAVRMVKEWGLSERVGPVGYAPDSSGHLGDGGFVRSYAEDTQRAIDQEVLTLLRGAEERALSLLGDHRFELDRVVDLLLDKETIDGAELMAVVRHSGPGIRGGQPEGIDPASSAGAGIETVG